MIFSVFTYLEGIYAELITLVSERVIIIVVIPYPESQRGVVTLSSSDSWDKVKTGVKYENHNFPELIKYIII